MASPDHQLVLGFDASCITCTGLASALQNSVGDRLGLVPLSSPRMSHWRKETLGEAAPWAPTLVRLKDGSPDAAWLGWQIAPVLAQHLGARRTWRVLGILGGEALSGQRREGGGLHQLVSRVTFLRAGVGVVAGMALLAAGAGRASAKPTSDAEAQAGDTRELHGEELTGAVVARLRSEDAANVLDARSLTPAAGLTSLAEVSSGHLREFTSETGEAAAEGSPVEVLGREITYPNGVSQTVLLMYQHEQRLLLYSQEFGAPTDGLLTSIHRLHVDDSVPDGALKTVARSINGAAPEPVPAVSLTNLAADPCGGCDGAGPGSRHRYTDLVCNTTWDWDCIRSLLSAAGCGGCLVACAVGKSIRGCIFCVATSCAPLIGGLDDCCDGAREVCTPCATQT